MKNEINEINPNVFKSWADLKEIESLVEKYCLTYNVKEMQIKFDETNPNVKRYVIFNSP